MRWPAQRSFNSGDEVPHDAIEGGKEADGSPLYVARAEIDGHWHPGKFGAQTGRGALVGYAGKEKYFGKYQLLCGDKDSVKWVDRSGPTTACEGFTPVEGGSDSEGNPLWVCHVQVQDSIVPGK